jgi:hypothetical protein
MSYNKLEYTKKGQIMDALDCIKRYLIAFLVLSSFLFISSTAFANTFVFYPSKLKWVAIDDNGTVVKSGRASGGRRYCPDIGRSCRTPSGTFSVISEGGPDCKSSRYPVGTGGAKMPYCMFFSKYYAIHGSDDVPNYNASHGCIRVRPADARWLQHNFISIGSRVVVKPY